MLDLEALASYLAAGGLAAPVAFNHLPDGRSQDEVVAIDDTGGLPMTLQRAFDRPTVQVRARSPSQPAAKSLAYQVDRLIVDADTPFDLAGRRVIDTGRVGGAPYYLGTDDRNRDTYTANYWLEIER